MNDLSLFSVDQLRIQLAQGIISPAEVTAACVERCRTVDALTHCFAKLDEDGATRHAAKLQDSHRADNPKGMLWGVPYAHKDVFHTEARRPAAGSRLSRLPIMAGDTSVLHALEHEGAVGMGALVLDEISYGATGLNEHYGHCRNPWDTRFISGGSSSGAAAAVAARALPFAIGSDTAGSTRIPAALCGAVGFKPTFGRLHTAGMVPLSPSQDTVGLIARTVLDCGWVMDAMSRHVSHAVPPALTVPGIRECLEQPVPLAGLRIGVCRHPFFITQTAEAEDILSQAIRVLEQLGATIRDQTLTGVEDCDAAATVITWVEARNNYLDELRTSPDKFSRSTRMRLETAIAPTADDYRRALAYRAVALNQFIQSAFSDVDILLAPTVTIATPRIDVIAADPSESVKTTTAFLRSNRCFSYLGLPALSVPAGFSSDGLPVGLQLIGKPWAETRLLRCGAAYQGATDWHTRLPPLSHN